MAQWRVVRRLKGWIAMGSRRTHWDFESYDNWRRQFLEHRLRLTIVFAGLYLISFLPLDVYHYVATSDRHPLALLWVAVNLARLACLGISGLILRWGPPPHRGTIGFLWASLSLNGLQRGYDTVRGFAHSDLLLDPDLFSWAMIFITQATLMPVRWRLHLFTQLATALYYFGVNPLLGLTVIPEGMAPANLFLNLAWVFAICNFSIYFYEQVAMTVFRANRQLKAAQARSERLLLNILPGQIADRLKRDNRTIAENFTEVTVLFADIVGFTQLTQRMSPIALVELLNQVFSQFDHLTDRYRLEKIKTIGDAYMVVAGLPDHRSDHAAAIANMALDMQAVIDRVNDQRTDVEGDMPPRPLAIRIGIHTGPVVAGVIGLKKFAYDLWGDTVNLASRLESHGIPGKIQVSPSTYACLCKDYDFEARGPVELKGQGVVQTYLLVGKRGGE
ncbi:MAG: adenylate/guanylate cyclase domain-containing protein [Cyanobacteria bacterium]|nr:adenylate/guanylate cyclase domain-containing protein [Cyanobacteriota bacterium]